MLPCFPGPTLEAVGRQTPSPRWPAVAVGRSLPARVALATVLTLALALGLAAQARADAFGQTFTDYKSHGSVDPCKFSVQVLKKAKQQVPPDIEQYAPDFPGALEHALQARAAGGCPGAGGAGSAAGAGAGASGPGSAAGGGPSAGAGSGAGSAPSGGPGSTPAPPAVTSATDPGVPDAARLERSSDLHGPAALIAAGVLALLLALAALLFYAARRRGWEPRWFSGLRYAMGEAGYRAGATWSEFADWLRLGH